MRAKKKNWVATHGASSMQIYAHLCWIFSGKFFIHLFLLHCGITFRILFSWLTAAFHHLHVYMYTCMYVRMCVCVCVALVLLAPLHAIRFEYLMLHLHMDTCNDAALRAATLSLTEKVQGARKEGRALQNRGININFLCTNRWKWLAKALRCWWNGNSSLYHLLSARRGGVATTC